MLISHNTHFLPGDDTNSIHGHAYPASAAAGVVVRQRAPEYVGSIGEKASNSTFRESPLDHSIRQRASHIVPYRHTPRQ
jgi:hypothetical protein